MADAKRVVVLITNVQQNFKAAQQEGGGADSEIYYVRKSSMRDKNVWPALKAGDRVEVAFRVMSGRAIVADAVPLPRAK